MSIVQPDHNETLARRGQAVNRVPLLAIVPLLLTFAIQLAQAQTFTVLYDFTNGTD